MIGILLMKMTGTGGKTEDAKTLPTHMHSDGGTLKTVFWGKLYPGLLFPDGYDF